jgi:hypothetical protein
LSSANPSPVENLGFISKPPDIPERLSRYAKADADRDTEKKRISVEKFPSFGSEAEEALGADAFQMLTSPKSRNLSGYH